MRLTICLTAALALCACSKQAEAPPAANNDVAEANTAATAPAAAPMVTANGSTPGKFEVTFKNGKKGQSMLAADGTYTDLDANGKETAKGTWNVTGGKTCFDPAGNEGPNCFAETAPGPDGTFTATPEKGDPVTVKKVS
jgi:hypothetical protein